MYFVFVDESGSPGKTKKGKYFVLAGMVVKADNILALEKTLKKIKFKHGIFPDIEFKWSDRYSDIGLDYEQYCSFREAMFETINSFSETIVAAVLDKEESYKLEYINDHNDIYKHALYFIMERIHNWYNDEGTVKMPAVFVIDSREDQNGRRLDKELAKAYVRAIELGNNYYSGFPHFSRTPFFTSSHSSAGLQFADYCAGPIQRLFELGDSEWYNLIRGKLRKSPDGEIKGFGIKYFPNKVCPISL